MLQVKLTDDLDMQELIKKLPAYLQKESALEALVIAAQPAISAMRSQAPRGATGGLKASIGFRLRRYKGGKHLYVAIGPRRGVWGAGGNIANNQPAKYAHLVEFGHGKVGPNGFARRAWMGTKDAVLSVFKREFSKRLVEQIKKRRKPKKTK